MADKNIDEPDVETDVESEVVSRETGDLEKRVNELFDVATEILESVSAMRVAMDSFVASGANIVDDDDDDDDVVVDDDLVEILDDLSDLDFTINED